MDAVQGVQRDAGGIPAPPDPPAGGPERHSPDPQQVDDAVDRGYARLYGTPLFELPTDLYIPPDALEVFLEAFEGPLDLLLYLIRRQSFDILDIPMAEITRQYLGYIEEVRARNLELAAEYLLMAAMLIEIKSRGLLPRPRAEGEAEPEDPRAELARRLIEYERIKLAAARIDSMPIAGRDFTSAQATWDRDTTARLPQVCAADLQSAWREVLRRSKLVAHHRIEREQLSVRDYMTRVLRTLRDRPFAPFEDLFDVTRGVPVVVVTFVALLELAREMLVEITQAEPFAPIYVRLAVRAEA